MGRSIAIKYTVQMLIQDAAGKLHECTAAEWRVGTRGRIPGYGRPTLENLTQYVTQFEGSTQPKGCNEHLGVQKVVSAWIKDQSRGVVATYSAPANQNSAAS